MREYHRIICELLQRNGEDEAPVVLVTPLANKSQPLVVVPPNLRPIHNAYARAFLACERLKQEITTLNRPPFAWQIRPPVNPAVDRSRLGKELQEELDMGQIYSTIFFCLMSRALGRSVNPRWSFVQKDWMLHQFGEDADFCTTEESRQRPLPLEVAL